MNIERLSKEAFDVIGIEGSTNDGEGFIAQLWAQANGRFSEVAPLAAKDAQGRYLGFWGAMTDFSRAFLPWTDSFSKGLYLAGVEAVPGAALPAGFTRWRVPAFEYLRVQVGDDMTATFSEVIAHMRARGIKLVGAAQDYIDPVTGQPYQYFPIRRL